MARKPSATVEVVETVETEKGDQDQSRERKSSRTNLYLIPLRQIVGNTNPRNPLSQGLQKKGWTVFGASPKKNKPSLWELGTSDNPEERAEFVEIIQEHDQEIAALGANILSIGLEQAVEVRDNGAKSGKNTYTLTFGMRRTLATLFNWCVLGKPAEPVIEARFVKANESMMLHRAVSENIRKQPSVIEEAKGIQMALNVGEDKETLAQQMGVSVQTINNRLALLELPPEVQQKIALGKLKPTRALQQADGEAGSNGHADSGPRLRPKKAIEEMLAGATKNSPLEKALLWVLGRRDKAD